jgi:hypothetical protein
MRRAVIASVLVAAAAGSGLAQTARPALPNTGVDYSAVDEFYTIVAILSRGGDPTEAQWQALRATPGYRLVEIDNPGIRARLELAFKPSLAARRDSVIRADGELAGTVAHLRREAVERDAVAALRAKLERTLADSVATASARTAKYLPKGTMERAPTPLIAFAPFDDDGYSTVSGIVVDPLNVIEYGIVDLLAHELHHSYVDYGSRTLGFDELRAMRPPPPYPAVFGALRHLRNEGIADQIDKPYPFVDKDTARARRYNVAYVRTPAVLRVFDSVIVALPQNPLAARRLQNLFYSNGHPNGAYMARTIVETFGVDSLMPAVGNPFALVWTYAAAEAKRGHPPPLSPEAMTILKTMEKAYLKPLGPS